MGRLQAPMTWWAKPSGARGLPTNVMKAFKARAAQGGYRADYFLPEAAFGSDIQPSLTSGAVGNMLSGAPGRVTGELDARAAPPASGRAPPLRAGALGSSGTMGKNSRMKPGAKPDP